MLTYEDAVIKLQTSGNITLKDFKDMTYEDLVELLEEIKKWSLFANGKPEKLKKEKDKKKEKLH